MSRWNSWLGGNKYKKKEFDMGQLDASLAHSFEAYFNKNISSDYYEFCGYKDFINMVWRNLDKRSSVQKNYDKKLSPPKKPVLPTPLKPLKTYNFFGYKIKIFKKKENESN